LTLLLPALTRSARLRLTTGLRLTTSWSLTALRLPAGWRL
jgi:hypothetical protein